MTGLILLAALAGSTAQLGERDPRSILNGHVIPDEGYCDQPYVVITKDGHWLCTLTTGVGREGDRGQHIVATISADKGRTWSELIDIEPASGPDASWAMPLITPGGRVYVFYDYNGDHIDSLGSKKNIRADMLGWFVYKYSDDNGQTWSAERTRIPIRETEYDRTNDWKGKVQIGWSVGKPIIVGESVYVPFSKIGKYVIDKSEGWFFKSDNLLSEPDPSKHTWTMLPDGDVGLRSPEGPIAEEQNLVSLSDGSLFTVYRTVAGHPCAAYSRDGGRSWTEPAFARYSPGGRLIKHPRACPRLWKTKSGKYLLWFHDHGGKSYQDRNPAWISGGVEKDGFVHWSQPEILLYDPNPDIRISYPDLIEQDGRYWVTATQKTVARIHGIDPTLVEGLWGQGIDKTISRAGLGLAWRKGQPIAEAKMPRLPLLGEGGGFSIDVWLQVSGDPSRRTILDTRDKDGKGIVLAGGHGETYRLILSDGRLTTVWTSDPGTVRPGQRQHVVAIVDGGPKIIRWVIDGVLCDGGDQWQYGWARFSPQLNDVNGSSIVWHSPPSGSVSVEDLRVYTRALRTSEAVAHFTAGAE